MSLYTLSRLYIMRRLYHRAQLRAARLVAENAALRKRVETTERYLQWLRNSSSRDDTTHVLISSGANKELLRVLKDLIDLLPLYSAMRWRAQTALAAYTTESLGMVHRSGQDICKNSCDDAEVPA